MVPRSISRVTDSAVKISMVMVRMVPSRPGTMLRLVDGRPDCSARACGSRTAARRGLGNAAVVRSAVCTMLSSAPSAEPAATGSVASAATSSAGRSPRRTRALEVRRDLDRRTAPSPERSSRSNSASSRDHAA